MMVTRRILRTEHEAQGLSLEDDEDFAYLKKDGQVLVTFNAHSVTIKTILDEADKHINEGGENG